MRLLAVALVLAVAPAAQAADFSFNVRPGQPIALAGSGPQRLTVADFNGDGRPDFVVNNAGTTPEVWFGIGNGAFAAGPLLPDRADALAVGDFDGDGDTDIATLTDSSGLVAVNLNDGAGAFTVGPTITEPAADDHQLSAGDLDGDGRDDLFDAWGHGKHVLLMAAGGTPVHQASLDATFAGDLATLADLDGDGDTDVVMADNEQTIVYRNDGALQFTHTAGPALLDDIAQLTTADVNGDGLLDVVAAGDNELGVGLGGASGTEVDTVLPGVVKALGTGDLNGDGRDDLAVTTDDDQTLVARSQGDGHFEAPIALTTPGSQPIPLGLGVADLNGDGRLDVLSDSFTATGPVVAMLNASVPHPALTGDSMAFGTQVVGGVSAARHQTLANSGAALLPVARVRVTGPDAAEFLVTTDTCSAASVLVGASCGVGVRFAPATAGDKTATLTLNGTAVPLSGTGLDGQLAPTGAQGPIGGAGSDGADGAQGPAGAAGPAGGTGHDGATGPTGSSGPRGPGGAVGDTGPAGPAGTKGPTGDRGADGAAGPAQSVVCHVLRHGHKVSVSCSVTAARAGTVVGREVRR